LRSRSPQLPEQLPLTLATDTARGDRIGCRRPAARRRRIGRRRSVASVAANGTTANAKAAHTAGAFRGGRGVSRTARRCRTVRVSDAALTPKGKPVGSASASSVRG
jgi:hypothetical protein